MDIDELTAARRVENEVLGQADQAFEQSSKMSCGTEKGALFDLHFLKKISGRILEIEPLSHPYLGALAR